MKIFSRLLPAAALIGAFVAAGAATAQDGPMHDGPGGFGPGGFGLGAIDFAAIDADGDAALSRAELQARAAARLGEFDLNGDGALDRPELIAVLPQRDRLRQIFSPDPAEAIADRILAMHGGTTAGRVEIAVLSDQQVNRLMTRLDTDRDDSLARAEADATERHAGRRGSRGDMHGPRF